MFLSFADSPSLHSHTASSHLVFRSSPAMGPEEACDGDVSNDFAETPRVTFSRSYRLQRDI